MSPLRSFHNVLPWLFYIAVGTFLGLGGFTFHYAKGTSYFSNNPRACINCHIMQSHYDSWIKSSHHAVAGCNDCHVPHAFAEKYLVKAINGWNHSKAFTLQNFEEPIRISERNLKVAEHNCLYCHGMLTSAVAGHRDIERNAMSCTKCHRSVGHMEF